MGGLLTLELDGAETWICRFSGTKMREMQRFTRKLEAAIEDKPFPPERESAEAEYCPKCGAPYPDRGRAVCPKCSEKAYGVHADPGVFQRSISSGWRSCCSAWPCPACSTRSCPI